MKSKTIDDIKKSYEYKIDPFDCINTVIFKCCMLFAHFYTILEDYKFNENILEIKKNIKNKKDNENISELYDKNLNEITDYCEKIREKVQYDYSEIMSILRKITNDYIKNKDKPEASNIYQKICKNLIDKEVNKFIQYEKQLISYNDFIFNIKKNLTN